MVTCKYNQSKKENQNQDNNLLKDNIFHPVPIVRVISASPHERNLPLRQTGTALLLATVVQKIRSSQTGTQFNDKNVAFLTSQVL